EVQSIRVDDKRLVADAISKADAFFRGRLFETRDNWLSLACYVNGLGRQITTAGLDSVNVKDLADHLIEPRGRILYLIKKIDLRQGQILIVHLDQVREAVDVPDRCSQIVRQHFDEVVLFLIQVHEFLVAFFELGFSRLDIQPLRFDLTLLFYKDHSRFGADAIHLVDHDKEDQEDYDRQDEEVPDAGFATDQFRLAQQIAILYFLFLGEKKYLTIAAVEIDTFKEPIHVGVDVATGDRFNVFLEGIAEKVFFDGRLPVAVLRVNKRIPFPFDRKDILPLDPNGRVAGKFCEVYGKVNESERAILLCYGAQNVVAAGNMLDLKIELTLVAYEEKIMLISCTLNGDGLEVPKSCVEVRCIFYYWHIVTRDQHRNV